MTTNPPTESPHELFFARESGGYALYGIRLGDVARLAQRSTLYLWHEDGLAKLRSVGWIVTISDTKRWPP
jgi:hypothetical protein